MKRSVKNGGMSQYKGHCFILAIFCWAGLSLMVGCQPAAPPPDQPLLDADSGRDCRLASYSFVIRGKRRTLLYEHQQDKLMAINTLEDGEEVNMSMTYRYDSLGRMAGYEVDGSRTTYHYDPEGRIAKIAGDGNFHDRVFYYNALGQVSRIETVVGDSVYVTHYFFYDDAGAPEQLVLCDKVGDTLQVNHFRYDDKHNPYVGMGIIANSTELMFGYPVGNYQHNLIAYTSYFPVARMGYGAGERIKDTVIFRYNAYGYPDSLVLEGRSEMYLIYDCGEG